VLLSSDLLAGLNTSENSEKTDKKTGT
jgi:hypothetical protein